MYFLVVAKDDVFNWELRRNDGSALCAPPQAYDNLAAALTDIDLIKKWAPNAEVVISIPPPLPGGGA